MPGAFLLFPPFERSNARCQNSTPLSLYAASYLSVHVTKDNTHQKSREINAEYSSRTLLASILPPTRRATSWNSLTLAIGNP